MFFVVTAYDAPNQSAARAREYAAHRSHLDNPVQGVTIHIGGPLLDTVGDDNGSMFVLEAPDFDTARNYVEQDPFQTSGVWQTLRVTGFNWRRGAPA